MVLTLTVCGVSQFWGRKSQAVGSHGEIAEIADDGHGYGAGGLGRQSDGVVHGIAFVDGQAGGG